MKKIVLIGLVAVVAVLAALGMEEKNIERQGSRIGVVVPLEHRAMDEMVAGFREVISHSDLDTVKIEVQNAQGDLTIQRAMVDQFTRQRMDIVATIGTDVSLMAINRLNKTPLIAMDVTKQVNEVLSDSITGVQEASIEPSYRFVTALLPTATKVAMIYSASDKNYEMVQEFTALAQSDGLQVQALMIYSMADLYTIAKSIDSDVDAIFIAKDHCVASGAPILAKVAKELGVPFITSDEGSVMAGGTIALGNKEYAIGQKAGEICVRILKGEPVHNIPIEPLTDMTIFVNLEALKATSIDERTYTGLGYKVEVVGENAS